MKRVRTTRLFRRYRSWWRPESCTIVRAGYEPKPAGDRTMYNSHFGFSERPFSITPNPRFLFSSARHVEAMAHLLHGLRDGAGFVQLTGEVGTGKTTVCRSVLEQLPQDVDVALILNPALNATELLRTICEELRLEIPLGDVSLKQLVDLLNAHLLQTNAAGRQTVVILDEAQNLTPEVLEQVRLLTNLETETDKLLQIFLIGQPELRQILGRPGLRQLAQRVTARYHLMPLNLKETHGYIRHRLLVAGGDRDLFPANAVRRVFHHSAGIPRLVNIICDRALLGAYTRRSYKVGKQFVDTAATEIAGLQSGRRLVPLTNLNTAIGIVIPALLGSVAFTIWQDDVQHEAVAHSAHRPAAQRPAVLPAKPPAVAAQAAVTTPRPAQVNTRPDRTTNTVVAQRPARANGMPALPPAAPPLPVHAQQAERKKAQGTPPMMAAETQTAPEPTEAKPSDEPRAQTPPVQTTKVTATADAKVSPTTKPTAPSSRLLAYWGVRTEATPTNVCEAARRNGLQCFRDKAAWHALRELRWPALLSLPDATGMKQPSLLMGIDGETVSLLERNGSRDISRAEFQRLAPEEYLALWRRPTGAVVRTLREGMRGPDVIWLRETITKIHAIDLASEHPDIYDADLNAQVKIFQFTLGLDVDGIVGPQTVMQLTMAMHEPPAPRE